MIIKSGNLGYQLLDEMLKSERWVHLDGGWDDTQRRRLTLLWHKLNGTKMVNMDLSAVF